MARTPARREARLRDLQKALASVFTPGSPIDDPALFSGRYDLLEELKAELPVAGVHLVLYGERGVGKTSLWRVLLHHRKVQQHSASSEDDFVSIFLRVLEQLGEQFTASERKRLAEVSSSLGTEKVASLGSKVGQETSETPIENRRLDLNFVLDRVARRADSLDAVVIDEFQNISRDAVQTQIIEVVKGFADRAINIKILLVGVADSDDELIPAREYGQYKGRHFLARRVTRMSNDEVQDILILREQRYNVHFHDGVKKAVVQIASGYPATAHRLALISAQAWLRRASLRQAARWSFGALQLLTALSNPGLFSPFHVGSIAKAGIDVEQRDLLDAVNRFVKAFYEHHSYVGSRYDEAMNSNSAATTMRVLLSLAAAPTTRMPIDELAATSGLSRQVLEASLREDARGLVEVAGESCRLTVRELRPFMMAKAFVAAWNTRTTTG